MVGLKDLHKLTSGGKYRLQVDLKGPHGFYYYYQWTKNCYVAVYDNFQVTLYILSLPILLNVC